jgi:thiol-disulfide isomerase/thioredoxin
MFLKFVLVLKKKLTSKKLWQKAFDYFWYFEVLMMVFTVLITLYLLFTDKLFADEIQTGTRGYWNYQLPEGLKDEDKKNILIPPASELFSMDAEEFAELLEKTKIKALTTLKQADVTRYYFLQDVARRKASIFADKYKHAIQTFNENYGGIEREFSAIKPAKYERENNKKAEIARVLNQYKPEYGIVYFYSETCSYCKGASEVLDLFQLRNQWTLERVEISERPALAEYYKIKVVPTTILVRRKDKQRFFLTAGTISVLELEDRITNIIREVEESKNEMENTGVFDPYFYLRPENAVFLDSILKSSNQSHQ